MRLSETSTHSAKLLIHTPPWRVQVATAVSDLATLLVTPPAPSGAESGGDALAAAQAHIAHLATLLAESESTVERMVEQSKVPFQRGFRDWQ